MGSYVKIILMTTIIMMTITTTTIITTTIIMTSMFCHLLRMALSTQLLRELPELEFQWSVNIWTPGAGAMPTTTTATESIIQALPNYTCLLFSLTSQKA